MTASEKGGQEPVSGGGNRKEPRAGGWFEAQKEGKEEEDGESKRCNEDEDEDEDEDDYDASKGSCSGATLSFKRRHDGEGGNLLRGGSSDEGQGEDEGEGDVDGGARRRCWRGLSERTPARCNSLMLSYERGNTSDLVQCIIVRDVSSYIGAIQIDAQQYFAPPRPEIGLNTGLLCDTGRRWRTRFRSLVSRITPGSWCCLQRAAPSSTRCATTHGGVFRQQGLPTNHSMVLLGCRYTIPPFVLPPPPGCPIHLAALWDEPLVPAIPFFLRRKTRAAHDDSTEVQQKPHE